MIRYILGLILALSVVSTARAQSPQELKICSGSTSGNYYWAAKEIARFLSQNMFKITVIETQGSLDNLRKIASKVCDIGFAQSDVNGQYMIENPATKDNLSVLAHVYTEYVHILCPTSSGWSSLSDMANAKGARTMIVGGDGTGTSETWRILRAVQSELYDGIKRDPSPSDFASAHDVAKSSTTCMLWISGLNSNDMVSTNAFSGSGKGGKPTLRLLSVDDKRFLDIKGPEGKPLYTVKTIVPTPAKGSTPALYDHLINNSGIFSSASIDVLSVPADMIIRLDYKEAIGRQKLTLLLQAIDDAQASIWAKVDPADSN